MSALETWDDDALSRCREMVAEALSVHEILCRLGFAPAAIRAQLAHTSTPEYALFCERTKPYDICIHVGVAAQGLTWRICVGPASVDGVTFEREMKRAMAAWNREDDPARMYYQGSRAANQASQIRAAIEKKGFRIPRAR